MTYRHFATHFFHPRPRFLHIEIFPSHIAPDFHVTTVDHHPTFSFTIAFSSLSLSSVLPNLLPAKNSLKSSTLSHFKGIIAHSSPICNRSTARLLAHYRRWQSVLQSIVLVSYLPDHLPSAISTFAHYLRGIHGTTALPAVLT